MPWIVKNLRLIPALSFLAAGLNALSLGIGAERRQRVAHAVRHGYQVAKISSPGGAEGSTTLSGADVTSTLRSTTGVVGHSFSPWPD